MLMQSTANLWEILCGELEARRQENSRENHRDAIKHFKETALQVFPPTSPRLCDALEISGDVHQASGYLQEAAEDFNDALTRNLEQHAVSAAARVAAKLALLQERLGQDAEAIRNYTLSLELYDAAHDHSQHCLLANNLAALEKRAGDFTACERHYKQALETTVQLHGEVHPEVALVCNNLGVAYNEAGDTVSAENLHMRALGIREQVFGAMHPEVAQSLGNLAVVYHTGGNRAKARAFYEAAIKTYESFKKPGAPEVASLRAGLEKLERNGK